MSTKAIPSYLRFSAVLFFALHLFIIGSGQAVLVGSWKMNEGSGATLTDNSGNGNNATLQNIKDITWVTGKEGLALSMPGTTGRFAIAPNNASLNITDAISIAAWARPTEVGYRTILSKSGTNGYELALNKNGKVEFRFNADANGNTYQVFSNASYPFDGTTWIHIAATYDGTTTKIYINGLLDKSLTFSTPASILTNTSGLYIGSLLGDRRWKGALDDVRLYHGALSALEVSQLAGVAVSLPAAPTLSAPTNSSINIPYNQALSWNAVNGANQYRVEVSTNINFTTTFLAQDLTGLSVSLTGLSASTIYYWRVRASNLAGNGNWSAVWSFTTLAPPPPGTATLVGQWKMNEGSGATLVDNSGYGNNAILQNTSDVTWVAGKEGLALNLPATTGRFAIAPNQATLNITDKITIAGWIRPLGKNTMAILAKTGSDGYEIETNSNGKIEFKFNATTNGSTYRLYSNTSYPTDGVTWMHVAATYDGTSSKIYINGILDQSITFSNPVPIKTNTSGLYIGALLGANRWKGALDDLRLYSGVLTAAEIIQLAGTLAIPVLSAPANASINIAYNPTLSWSAVSGATKYRLEVSADASFATTFLAQDDIATTNLALSGLSPNTLYYWRVRAANTTTTSNWSAVWNFTTLPAAPVAPTLAAPANGAVDIPFNPTLSWNTVSGATKYRVEVSADNSFATTFLAQDDILTTSLPLTGLLPGTVYYWRVRGSNIAGNGNWSSVSSFTTLPLPPVAPALGTPVNGATNIPSNQSLSWNAVSGATKYRVEVSDVANFSTTFLAQDNVVTTSLALSNLLTNTVYYWRVRASNNGGDGNWSAVWSFTTAAPLPALTLIHYWNFNGASVAAMLTPSLTLTGGSITESLLAGSTSEIGTANNFAGVNARNGDVAGNHYRLNLAVGSVVTFNIPTANYKNIVFKYETRRSTSGTETQKISYTTDGSTYVPYQTLSINNVTPDLITFDFSSVTAVNNNPNFKIKIEFEGTNNGNNRFDNATVEGEALAAVPLPAQVVTTAPANNQTGVALLPDLSWQAATGAAAYKVQVATDNLFTNIVVDKTVSSLTYKVESALNVGTNYFWRVRGSNATGDGPWSTVQTFITIQQILTYKIAINEAMSSNTSVITDNDGTYQDWIEIVNYGTTPVNLQGFGLTDDPTLPYKWIFPAKTMAPGEFMIVWASNKNRTDPNQPLHTNFAISSSGEELVVTSPDGQWSDNMPSIAIPANQSRGRQPDGTGNYVFFSTPTPGSTNIGGIGEIITRASFSQAPGIYATNLTLAITHPDPAVTIRYTLDGSEPTETSTVYQQPLAISDRSGDPNVLSLIPTNKIVGNSRAWAPPTGLIRKGTVIRVKCFKPNAVASETITGTYLVLPGRQYTVPVISVVLPKDSMFGFDRGIYVPGKDYVTGDDDSGNYYQSGDSSERAGSIEFFSPDLNFQQNIGYRINGDFTRRFPQKSLRLVARSDYGKSSLNYPVFPNYSLATFKRLVLSSSGNDWGHTMFKDAVAHMFVEHFINTERYQPSVVFINGEYWGIHNIRERTDKFYLAQRYGVNEDNIDYLFDQYDVEEGDNIDYKEMLDFVGKTDLTSNTNFEGVKYRMDVENYLDFYSAEVYYANTDWPQSNTEFWRAKIPGSRNPTAPAGQDGRWRWLFHDLDVSFENPSYNAIDRITQQVNPTANSEWPNFLFRKLLTNPDFKTNFINRIADQLNTAFVPARMHQKIDSVRLLIDDEIPEHIQRWTRPLNVNTWTKEVDSLKYFATNRPAFLRQHVRTKFALGTELTITLDVNNQSQGIIKLNSLVINNNTAGLSNAQQPYPWQGIYFGNVPVKLRALPNPGFALDHWLIDGQSFSTDEMTITPTANASVKAFFVQTTGVKPVLIAPASAATNVAVPSANFSWQAVAQATSYRLQVSMVADFSTKIYDQNNLSTTNADVAGLVYNTTYYWRVMAKGPNGMSDWSDTRIFTTVAFPAVVQLTAPADQAVNVPVNAVFSWNAAATATNYSLQVSTKSDFSSFIISKDNIQATTLPYTGLLRNQLYYWRVKANNINGSSAWAQRSFTTAALAYDADLVGHWKMNEDTGVTLLDYSGYGNHAKLQTLNDVFRVTGIEGLALSLQGSTNRFAIAPNSPSLNITNQITIAAWIRPTEVGTRTILSKAGTDGYELATNSNGKIEFRFNPDTYGSTYRLLSVAGYPADGTTWMHVAATFDGTSSKIYINGILNASITFPTSTTIISNTSGLYIGSLLTNRRWKGSLDDLQLYKRALSATEILNIVSPQPVTTPAPMYSIEIPVEQKSRFTAYPNPFNDKIILNIQDKMRGDVTISIVDAAGRTFYSQRHKADAGQLTINTAGARLTPGVYFLVIRTATQKEYIKVVKN